MPKKPVLDWNKIKFEKNMLELGFKVEFIEKPITIENLVVEDSIFDISKISDYSKQKIQNYLNEKNADGAIVLDVSRGQEVLKFKNEKRISEGMYHRSYGDVTLALYVLKPIR